MNVAEMAYDAAGLDAVGYLASPHRSDPHEAVLICHEGPGQDDHVRWRADRIASELGYTAFALDYHEGGRVLSPEDFTSRLALLRSHPVRADQVACRLCDARPPMIGYTGSEQAIAIRNAAAAARRPQIRERSH